MKAKSFYKEKKTTNTMKRQPMEWKKIFANHISHMGLMFKTHKEDLKSIAKTNKKQKKTPKTTKTSQTSRLKNEQRILIDIPLQKICKWSTSI